jgi:hypothetical protein
MLSADAAGKDLGREQPGDHRVGGGTLEGGGHRLERDQRVEHADVRVVQEPLCGKGDRARPGESGGTERELASVHRVGDGAAVQPEPDQGHQRTGADDADRERAARDRVDLDRDRDRGHLLAQLGDGVADPEPPERRGHAERPDVGGDGGQDAPPSPRHPPMISVGGKGLVGGPGPAYARRTRERRWSEE